VTRRTTAPYKVGDKIRVLHSCDHSAHGGGTALATFTVERVTQINPDGYGARWRISTTRCDGSPLETTVRSDGRDVHDYVAPA